MRANAKKTNGEHLRLSRRCSSAGAAVEGETLTNFSRGRVESWELAGGGASLRAEGADAEEVFVAGEIDFDADRLAVVDE